MIGGSWWRVAAVAAVTGLVGLAASGCGSLSLQGAQLPGGANLGSEPFEVTVEFRDVLDLVPQATVKVNNVTVGQVKTVTLNTRSWLADAHLEINNDVVLPANADAQLKQTTLLGEKYIELGPPSDGPPRGRLPSGAVVPVQRTNRFPEVEELFGALSMLLNGGGIGQVQNIASELNKALDGHEADTRALLDDVNTLTSTLDGQKGNITRALDGVDKLSASLVAQRGNLDSVLTDLQPGLAVLNEQRPQLVGMLNALDKLSGVATDVVNRSHDDLVADLRALRPTLRELARTGNTLPNSLQIFATPPFTDSAVGAIRGDYMNLNTKIDLNIQDLLDNLLNATTPPVQLPSPANLVPPGLITLPKPPPASNQPNQPNQPRLPGLGGLPGGGR